MSHMDWVLWYYNKWQWDYYYGKYSRLGTHSTYGTYRKEIPPLAVIGLVPWWYWLYNPAFHHTAFQWHQNTHQNSLFWWHMMVGLWPLACWWCQPSYKKRLLSWWFHVEPTWNMEGNNSFPWKLGENPWFQDRSRSRPWPGVMDNRQTIWQGGPTTIGHRAGMT